MKESIIFEDIENIYNRSSIDWKRFKNSCILVTGPNGMLASYIVYTIIWLNDNKNFNIKLIAMARSFENFSKRFGEYGNRSYIKVLTDSILSPININEDIDYIIHAASLASPQYYDVCPVDVLSPNVIGTYYLLQLAVNKKIKDFIMFSSADVYGVIQNKQVITEEDMGIVDPLDIHSCYSESKRMAETMCYSFMHQYNVPIKMLRIWHTYAPTMDVNKDPRVFASFMKNIIEGKDIEIKSDGNGMRTFCYIADAVAGLFTVITKGANGEAYNVCNTEQFVSVRELAQILVDLRKDVSIKVIYKQRSKTEHYVENTAISQSVPSNEKLKQLGWSTEFDIKKGFERVYLYLK